jgi:hypothetical protein
VPKHSFRVCSSSEFSFGMGMSRAVSHWDGFMAMLSVKLTPRARFVAGLCGASASPTFGSVALLEPCLLQACESCGDLELFCDGAVVLGGIADWPCNLIASVADRGDLVAP